MKINLKNYCYIDAIFYADKIMHLQSSSTDKFVKAVYDLGKSLLLNICSALLYAKQGVLAMCLAD